MRLRAPSFDDAEAVLAVLLARDVADYGEPDYTLEDLHDEWSLSEVDLAADAVVAEDAAGIVGYALVRGQGAYVVVDPEREGEGIGAELLRWSESRARARGQDRLRQWLPAANARGQALLRDAGYAQIRSYWRLARALDEALRPPAPPPGIALRALELAADAEALHALSEAAFAGNKDYEPETLQEFSEEHLGPHSVAPERSVLAVRDGALAGFALCRVYPGESLGFVDLLAVHPDERRRGLGEALLLAAFAALKEAGLREAQLGVASDNPRALRLYERAGMTIRFRSDVFERPAD